MTRGSHNGADEHQTWAHDAFSSPAFKCGCSVTHSRVFPRGREYSLKNPLHYIQNMNSHKAGRVVHSPAVLITEEMDEF